MVAGTRVFTGAKKGSPSGCKKLGKHGSRKGAVRRSAHLITDYKGDEYERVEYTPYGEYWIEKRAPENRTLPFKFTGKERDEETGLYYYGARYLDAKTSRWLTTDPALSDYIPLAPVNDEARKHNQNLPGMGGIYNTVNFHLYHYAGNNPIRYIDPTGMWVDNEDGTYTAEKDDTLWGLDQEIFGDGSRWEEFCYEGDPTKLQVGDTVGKQKTATITHEQNSLLGILEVPDITQKTGVYDIVAGAELIGLGASLATAGGVAGSEIIAAIGAGTISAGGAVAGVVTTVFLCF